MGETSQDHSSSEAKATLLLTLKCYYGNLSSTFQVHDFTGISPRQGILSVYFLTQVVCRLKSRLCIDPHFPCLNRLPEEPFVQL